MAVSAELAAKIVELFEDEGLTILQDGDWVQEHKYQFRTSIVEYEGKTYGINESRSGSYHTDWYYDDPSVDEVEKKEEIVTITKWVAI